MGVRASSCCCQASRSGSTSPILTVAAAWQVLPHSCSQKAAGPSMQGEYQRAVAQLFRERAPHVRSEVAACCVPVLRPWEAGVHHYTPLGGTRPTSAALEALWGLIENRMLILMLLACLPGRTACGRSPADCGYVNCFLDACSCFCMCAKRHCGRKMKCLDWVIGCVGVLVSICGPSQ